MDWNGLASRVIEGATPTRAEALAVLESPEDALLDVLSAAFRVRRRHFGRDVHLHVLQNAKSGVCPEDCGFCSQSVAASEAAGVDRYPIQSVDELVEGARKAHAAGAMRYCMVTATRGPSSRDLDAVCEATRRIKAELDISVCASLGLLGAREARTLADAGVDRFNHNLETSRRRFPDVVTTHTWEDRVETVRAAKAAGMEACCGGILGLGEDLEDRVDLAFELRALDVESVPVNFLDPRPGTPLSGAPLLSPADALRALALFRFVHPDRDVRVAGGRERTLRDLQALALWPANSLFARGYLTTGGQGLDADLVLIRDAGFRAVRVASA